MTAEIVPQGNLAELERIDPAYREQEVTRYLAHARDQLTLAVNLSGPAAVAALKAEIATAAEATKQLGLSKEIQTDAQEMVRRAEYALGKAIRAGQERGEIRKHGQSGGPAQTYLRGESVIVIDQAARRTSISSPTEYLEGGHVANDVYAMVDGVTEPQFEAALSDARAEDNVSRANVVRKIKGVQNDGLTPVEKLGKIRELAPSGMTSGQIAKEIGVSEEYVRRVAREREIEIPADKILRGTHRVKVDHDHLIGHLVMTLEVVTQGLDDIDIDTLDDARLDDWADSLTTTTRVLNRFVKRMKEKAQ